MIKVLGHLRTIKKDVIAAMLFVVLGQLLTLTLPLLMALIINKGIANADMDYIMRIGSVMIAISLLSAFVSALSSYFSSKTSANYGRIIREKIFFKVESLSQGDIDIISTPSLITRCTNDVRVLQDFILQSLRMILSAPIMLIGGTFMAFFLNARLAMIIFAVIPIIAVIAFIVVKTVMPLFRKRQKMTDEVNRFLREKLSGIRVIRAFNMTESSDESFSEKNHALSALVLKFSRIIAVLLPICIVLVVVALDLLIFIATKNIDSLTDTAKIQSTVGDLQAFVIYMIMIIASVTMAATMFVIVPRANISARRINEVLEIEPRIKDAEVTEEPHSDKKGLIEFKNVSFTYEDDGRKALHDISFTAESGKVTAIIGSTGSGKTTLVNLMLRFYDVTQGSILFDGVDIRKLPQKVLHEKISCVAQKAVLFSGSVEDNLRFADNDATEERMRFALDVSQSSEFVEALPEKTKSFISQSGTNLSGGQKQRISIARALVRESEVYIFDDSFCALDFRTDAKLRAAIRKNIDSTVIIVAQRIGTILDADKIIVLDEGRIVGEGTHDELLTSCDVYREIALSQLSKEVLK